MNYILISIESNGFANSSTDPESLVNCLASVLDLAGIEADVELMAEDELSHRFALAPEPETVEPDLGSADPERNPPVNELQAMVEGVVRYMHPELEVVVNPLYDVTEEQGDLDEGDDSRAQEVLTFRPSAHAVEGRLDLRAMQALLQFTTEHDINSAGDDAALSISRYDLALSYLNAEEDTAEDSDVAVGGINNDEDDEDEEDGDAEWGTPSQVDGVPGGRVIPIRPIADEDPDFKG